MEDGIRNFYRDKICDCDTMRTKLFFDENKIPYFNYYSVTGNHIGKQYNPSLVAEYANKYFELGDTTEFLNFYHWFNNNIIETDSTVFVTHNYDWYYNMKSPWKSSMSQALMLKTYVQAFLLLKDSNILFKSKKIINTFQFDVDYGGVTHLINDSTYWFEEYSQINGEKPMILNGMMTSLLGLIYYYESINDINVKNLIDKGLNGVKLYLPEFDSDRISYYDIKKNYASEYYHDIHIDLLEKLYEKTKIELFKEYRNSWSKFKKQKFFNKLIKSPNKSSVITLLFVFILMFSLITLVIRKKHQ